MKQTNLIVTLILLALLGALVVYPVWSNRAPLPVDFKPLTPQSFAALIGWLFAVALFVERAVEVVVMIFRDQQADMLDEAEKGAARDLAEATKTGVADAVVKARQALMTARQNKLVYRAETKEMALVIGFGFGLLVSLAGVRALHGLLLEATPTGNLFLAADIVVTGALLAGGSEGIHRMANAFTSFMDGVSARGDQAQRKANEDKKTNP
jgi:hypothetical protein